MGRTYRILFLPAAFLRMIRCHFNNYVDWTLPFFDPLPVEGIMKYSYFMLLTPPTLYFCNLIAQFCADIAESPLLLAIKKGLLPELRALWDIILASSPYVSTTHLYTYHHFLHFANKLSFSNQSPLYSIRLLTKKLHIFSIGHNTSLVRTVFIPWAHTKTNIFYPLSPHLVHVFIEWPLRLKW